MQRTDGKTMMLSINGESREVAEGCTVAALLAALGMGDRRVAVAVNRNLVLRSAQASHALHDGDRIEIVQAVQGG